MIASRPLVRRKEKAALLVFIGANSTGEKVILAVESGYRESTESWSAVLRDLKSRGLRSPKLTIADGHLGIWSGLAAVYPESAEQRCWNHNLRNVLEVVPKKHQAEVKAKLQEIASAATRKECEALRREFRRLYEHAFPKAVERLERDWDRMVTYYNFPEPHWKHIRTTNIIDVPICSRPTSHRSSEEIQEGEERDCSDLEDVTRSPAELATHEC